MKNLIISKEDDDIHALDIGTSHSNKLRENYHFVRVRDKRTEHN